MERASHKRGLFAGEPCAHEGGYFLARPVDWAFNLSHDPAMLNDVGSGNMYVPMLSLMLPVGSRYVSTETR